MHIFSQLQKRALQHLLICIIITEECERAIRICSKVKNTSQEVVKWLHFTRMKLFVNGNWENMLTWLFIYQKTCRRNENQMWIAIETGCKTDICWEILYMLQVIILKDIMGNGSSSFSKGSSTTSHGRLFRHCLQGDDIALRLYRIGLLLLAHLMNWITVKY